MRISNRPIAGAASAFLLLFALAATTASAFARAEDPAPLTLNQHGSPTSDVGPIGGGPGHDGDPCDSVAVPDGNVLAFALFAEGGLIYRWDGANWTLVTQKAVLLSPGAAKADSTDGPTVLGTLVAGPTWQGFDGSRVVGTLIGECLPSERDAGAVQLFEAVDTDGFGLFTAVTFIQRTDTSGGFPPSDRGDFVGQKVKVPFTAIYSFYRSAK